MDFTGKLNNITIDYRSRKPVISFEIGEQPNGLDELQGKDLKITVVRRTKPRSLDSNAYFHVLVDKLRQKLGISFAACKNELITSYGQVEYVEEGHSLIYKTNAPPEYIKEREEVHMKYLKTGEDGAHWYKVYRGSHTYNTEEMAKLIEGTIAECKAQGIETATPEQILQMQALWERHYEKQVQRKEG